MLAAVPTENGAPRRGAGDQMLNGTWQVAARMPKRVVVELHPSEYEALEAFCRGRCCTVPEMVRVVALRLARAF
jgi:hypothetical protein